MAFWDSWFGKRKGGSGANQSKSKTAADSQKAAKAAKDALKRMPAAPENPAIASARGKGRVAIDRRFKLIARLGQGSMSKVWRASDSKSGNLVVVKVLDKPKTDQLKKRFIGMKRPDEGVVAAQLDHPNIVKTYEFGLTTKGEEYLVMEFVDGVGFNFLVETRASQLIGNEAKFLIPIAEALAYFHKKGFIHRDICPRNVMVSSSGEVKLIDFGLAVPNEMEFRRPGNRTGTANYMAPELIRRSTTDQRIDIYSFGVTAYETYTGKLPREATVASLDSMMRFINSPPRNPKELNPQLTDEVTAMLLKGIESDPNLRYQTMDDFINALRRVDRSAENSE